MNPNIVVRDQAFSIQIKRTAGTVTTFGIKWEGGDPADLLYDAATCVLKTTVTLPAIGPTVTISNLNIKDGSGVYFGNIVIYELGTTKKVYSKPIQITDIPPKLSLFLVWLWQDGGTKDGSNGDPCDYVYRVKYPGFLKADVRCGRDADAGLLGTGMFPEKFGQTPTGTIRQIGKMIKLPPTGGATDVGYPGWGYFDPNGIFHLYDDGSLLETGMC